MMETLPTEILLHILSPRYTTSYRDLIALSTANRRLRGVLAPEVYARATVCVEADIAKDSIEYRGGEELTKRIGGNVCSLRLAILNATGRQEYPGHCSRPSYGYNPPSTRSLPLPTVPSTLLSTLTSSILPKYTAHITHLTLSTAPYTLVPLSPPTFNFARQETTPHPPRIPTAHPALPLTLLAHILTTYPHLTHLSLTTSIDSRSFLDDSCLLPYVVTPTDPSFPSPPSSWTFQPPFPSKITHLELRLRGFILHTTDILVRLLQPVITNVQHLKYTSRDLADEALIFPPSRRQPRDPNLGWQIRLTTPFRRGVEDALYADILEDDAEDLQFAGGTLWPSLVLGNLKKVQLDGVEMSRYLSSTRSAGVKFSHPDQIEELTLRGPSAGGVNSWRDFESRILPLLLPFINLRVLKLHSPEWVIGPFIPIPADRVGWFPGAVEPKYPPIKMDVDGRKVFYFLPGTPLGALEKLGRILYKVPGHWWFAYAVRPLSLSEGAGRRGIEVRLMDPSDGDGGGDECFPGLEGGIDGVFKDRLGWGNDPWEVEERGDVLRTVEAQGRWRS